MRLEGKKAKNATYISGNKAGKISREVVKVEKRHNVKSMLVMREAREVTAWFQARRGGAS